MPHGLAIVAEPVKAPGGMLDESTFLAKGKELAPGESETVMADLKPGRYELVCFMAGHFAAGQKLPFEVKWRPSASGWLRPRPVRLPCPSCAAQQPRSEGTVAARRQVSGQDTKLPLTERRDEEEWQLEDRDGHARAQSPQLGLLFAGAAPRGERVASRRSDPRVLAGAQRVVDPRDFVLVEAIGEHPVGDDDVGGRPVASSTATTSSSVSLTGISAGVQTRTTALRDGSPRKSRIWPACRPIGPTRSNWLYVRGA